MGRLLLLLRLEGPLQSWGTRARWDVRDTALEPTKSGVIGLIGCALGLRRRNVELESLDRSLQFAVRVDRPGLVATDYHTVSGYHRTAAGDYRVGGAAGQTVRSLAKACEYDENTIVSLRDYLHDASFLVALASDDEMLLRQLAGEASHPEWRGNLRRPAWPLYLGRRSCVPTRPVFARLTRDYECLEDALRGEPWEPWELWEEPREPWVGAHRRGRVPSALDAWVEDTSGEIERQDALRVNVVRFYGFRRCRHVSIPTSSLPRGQL